MTKISKKDIKNNLHNCSIIMGYTLVISIVYDAWIFYTINWLWLLILLPIIVICGGLVISYLSTVKQIKQNQSINDEKANDK